jgi:hypothetical protein
VKITLFFLAALCSFSMYAQTNVSGGIYQNTTWTLAGSPYMVTLSLNVPSGIYMIQGSNGKTVKVFIGN